MKWLVEQARKICSRFFKLFFSAPREHNPKYQKDSLKARIVTRKAMHSSAHYITFEPYV